MHLQQSTICKCNMKCYYAFDLHMFAKQLCKKRYNKIFSFIFKRNKQLFECIWFWGNIFYETFICCNFCKKRSQMLNLCQMYHKDIKCTFLSRYIANNDNFCLKLSYKSIKISSLMYLEIELVDHVFLQKANFCIDSLFSLFTIEKRRCFCNSERNVVSMMEKGSSQRNR